MKEVLGIAFQTSVLKNIGITQPWSDILGAEKQKEACYLHYFVTWSD